MASSNKRHTAQLVTIQDEKGCSVVTLLPKRESPSVPAAIRLFLDDGEGVAVTSLRRILNAMGSREMERHFVRSAILLLQSYRLSLPTYFGTIAWAERTV